MELTSTHPHPGIYQYSYPTFIDTPQLICIHFLTPDQQQAFVSYPGQRKAAQLIDISWFDSVRLVRLEGQAHLMQFLETILPQWLCKPTGMVISLDSLAAERMDYGVRELRVAFG